MDKPESLCALCGHRLAFHYGIRGKAPQRGICEVEGRKGKRCGCDGPRENKS
jgi:hypothetical protein